MNPDNQQQPQQQQTQPVNQYGQNQQVQPMPASIYGNVPADPGSKTKKILIVLGVLVGIFLLLIVFVVIFSSGSNKNNSDQSGQQIQPESLVKEPSAIEIENLNNSNSDDVSKLSTDNDFPQNNLSDEQLGL